MVKLYEMDDNVKIHTLMKKGLYMEAEQIARDANFPREIQSEIIKEYADKLFQQKKYDDAIDQFIKTIGFLNPSYVIQRYIQVTQLDNLIKYLEKLIREPKNMQMQSSSITDYNKDYTALLLNCYVKKDKKNEIKEFLTITNDTQPIFDVDTAIEVCRQQDLTREYAIDLAEKKQRWKLLVQIYIENQKLYKKALIKIDKNINNVREKVDMLQMYGPKLLKACERQDKEMSGKNYPSYNFIEGRTKEDERSLTTKDVMDVTFGIV